jgi:hypothetical protein
MPFGERLDHSAAGPVSATAKAYARKAKGSWSAQLQAVIQNSFDGHDDDARPSRVRLARVVQVAPDLRLGLWELPPAGAEHPVRHRLSDTPLLFVLDGRPSLRTGDSSEQLHPGDAIAFTQGKSGTELLSTPNERVRFLAFTTSADHSVAGC